jgi:hypothetical protein
MTTPRIGRPVSQEVEQRQIGFAGRFSGQTVDSDRSTLDHIRRRQR